MCWLGCDADASLPGHCFRRLVEFRVVALGGRIYILVCHVYCLAFARELFAVVLVERKENNLGLV
jgi:hypothetical protein